MAVYPPNLSSFVVRTVTVASPGTPVQGPNVRVPNGMELAVRLRSGGPGYVASSLAAAQSAALRTEVEEKEGVAIKVGNMNAVWVGAPAAGAVFEFLVEQ
jgi:hypothetical protein